MNVPEITEPVDLCAADGRLNRDAVGFARTPLLRANLRGWGRNKRWDYWGVVSPRFVIGMTIAGLDYAHLTQLYIFDREEQREYVADSTTLGPGDILLPDTLPPVLVMAENRKATFRFLDERDCTIIKVEAKGLSVVLQVERGGDGLGVVVPWSDRRFQYTLKEVALPASGSLTINGVEHSLGGPETFAVLDRGRGKWPYSVRWNWAAGAGNSNGHRLGLQLGGKWTDGTGVTENGLFVDGQLSYWCDDLVWSYDLRDAAAPWHVHGEKVDAMLTPFHRRRAASNLAVIAARTFQAFGTWSGSAIDDAGTTHSLDGLTGWAEEAKNRW